MAGQGAFSALLLTVLDTLSAGQSGEIIMEFASKLRANSCGTSTKRLYIRFIFAAYIRPL